MAVNLLDSSTVEERPYEGECVFPKDSVFFEIIETNMCVQKSATVELGQQVGQTVESSKSAGFSHMRISRQRSVSMTSLHFYRDLWIHPWYLEMVKRSKVGLGKALGKKCGNARYIQ